nr:hypothetical protein [Geobacter sp. AOG1]
MNLVESVGSDNRFDLKGDPFRFRFKPPSFCFELVEGVFAEVEAIRQHFMDKGFSPAVAPHGKAVIVEVGSDPLDA